MWLQLATKGEMGKEKLALKGKKKEGSRGGEKQWFGQWKAKLRETKHGGGGSDAGENSKQKQRPPPENKWTESRFTRSGWRTRVLMVGFAKDRKEKKRSSRARSGH